MGSISSAEGRFKCGYKGVMKYIINRSAAKTAQGHELAATVCGHVQPAGPKE